MNWLELLQAGAIYLVIAGALLAGLAASYGHELEAQRNPDRAWWVRRLLIIPVLAIVAAAATDLFSLTPTMAAFSTAMLSLGGYDVVCMIHRRWLKRLECIAANVTQEIER